MTLALIDGDEAIYKACVIKVEDTDWEAETVTDRLPTVPEVRRKFKEIVESWVEAVDADDFLICLSPRERGLFRRGFYPDYKQGRGEKPETYQPVEDWVRDYMPNIWYPGLEADDVMGVLSNSESIICSNDKDMKTVPGRLYITGKQQLVTITETRADWQWMHQTLTGDSTDGFGGCLGCGPKGADAALDGCRTLDALAFEARSRYLQPKTGKYRAVYQDQWDFRTNAIMARILRPGDYDPKTGYVSYIIPGFNDISFHAETTAR